MRICDMKSLTPSPTVAISNGDRRENHAIVYHFLVTIIDCSTLNCQLHDLSCVKQTKRTYGLS